MAGGTANQTPTAAFSVASAIDEGGSAVLVASASNDPDGDTLGIRAADGVHAAVTETVAVALTNVNEGPTISAIAEVSIPENTKAGPIAFTISDPDNPATSLTVTATSGDRRLIKDSDIVISGTGASRSVSFSPKNNKSGSTTITLAVTDGLLSTSTTFNVQVAAVNDAPEISAVSNQVIDEDSAPALVSFSVSDIDASVNDLVVTASSNNQSLIADTDITLSGTGSNRQISLTPRADAVGTTSITVVVSDGIDTGTQRFEVTVTPVNDAPKIDALAEITTPEDVGVENIPLTVSDIDNTSRQLTVTARSADQNLIKDGQIMVVGDGKTRRLNFVPVGNAFGATTITLSVSDGETTTYSTIDVLINAFNDAPGISSNVKHVYKSAGLHGVTSDAPGLFADVSDAENDALTIAALQPQNGTVVVKADGSFVYKPKPGFSGVDTFKYVISDTSQASAEGVVRIDVPINISVPGAQASQQSQTVVGETIETVESAVTEDSADGTDAQDNSINSVSEVASIQYASTDEDDRDDIPPPTSNAEDDDNMAFATDVELSAASQEFVFGQESDVSTTESERVRAQALRSFGELAATTSTHQDPMPFETSGQTRVALEFGYEQFTELQETVDQMDELQENLQASVGVTAMTEEVLIVGGTTIVVGSIITAVQSGMLALGFLAQLPEWTLFDPLMAMDGVGGEDGDSLQDIVDRQVPDEPTPKA